MRYPLLFLLNVVYIMLISIFFDELVIESYVKLKLWKFKCFY